MIYCFDIDNTICKTEHGDYENSIPIQSRIDLINRLYDEHVIIFNTSRGQVTKKDWSELTRKQLKDWGVYYHELLFTKPFADRYIDDHACKDNDFFHD